MRAPAPAVDPPAASVTGTVIPSPARMADRRSAPPAVDEHSTTE